MVQLPDNDIVLNILFYIIQSAWFILLNGGWLLFYVVANYPVGFLGGVGVSVEQIVKLATAAPSSGEGGDDADLYQRRLHEPCRQEREQLQITCQELGAMLTQEREKNRTLSREKEDAILRYQQQLQQGFRTLDGNSSPQDLDVASKGASSGEADTRSVNIEQVEHVCVFTCDGTHECGDHHLIAQLKWENSIQKYKADDLRKEVEQNQIIFDDLNLQLTEERRRTEAALREKAEALQRSLQQTSNVAELESMCGKYLAETRQLRRQSDQTIADLQRKLEAEEHRGRENEARLARELEEERKREHENVMKFVLALETKVEQMVKFLEANQLQEVAEILQREFNIRLLAVDNGLNFVFEASTEDWARLVEQKMQIQSVIERAIPKEARRQGLQWRDMQECPQDVDLKLCDTMPAGIASLLHRGQTSATGTGAPVAVPESFVPRKAKADFSILTSRENESEVPNISAVLDDPTSQRVFIADSMNNKIKYACLSAPDEVEELLLEEGVWALTHFRENVLAATGNGAVTIVDISDKPVVVNTAFTSRYYYGIATIDEDTLVVSCCREDDITDESGDGAINGRPASIDIIKSDGQLVKTVIDSAALPELKNPYYLCVVGPDVLISDQSSNCLFRVDLRTGQLRDTLRHEQMKSPSQVCSDGAGNVYVASHEGTCVLMMSPDGQWQQLLVGWKHGEGGLKHPWGVSVMGQYILVSWDDRTRHNSVVKGYLLS